MYYYLFSYGSGSIAYTEVIFHMYYNAHDKGIYNTHGCYIGQQKTMLDFKQFEYKDGVVCNIGVHKTHGLIVNVDVDIPSNITPYIDISQPRGTFNIRSRIEQIIFDKI